MKIKCRILSIFVVAILSIITLITIVIIAHKEDKKIVYAESITFVDSIRSAELFIDNNLILNDNLVCIKPNNCTLKPEFVVKRYGSDAEELITSGSYTFSSTGRYIVYCRVKSSEDYYKKDNMILTIVETPSSSTIMYITPNDSVTLYNEDKVELSSIVQTQYPSVANIKVTCNECLSLEDNMLKAVKEGVGTIDITLSYHNLVINSSFSLTIKAKVADSNIKLELSTSKILETNIVEIDDLEYSFDLVYNLLNIDDQQINCWTNSDIFEIENHFPPIITLKPKLSGDAILYISPINHANIVFEVIVRIA